MSPPFINNHTSFSLLFHRDFCGANGLIMYILKGTEFNIRLHKKVHELTRFSYFVFKKSNPFEELHVLQQTAVSHCK